MTDEKKQPHLPEPYWRENLNIRTFDKLSTDIEADIVIVGGGITGITTAYLLTKEGFKVAVIEADVLLNGTTGHTTAKVTAQHGVIYDELINHIGKEKARLYYEANDEAMQFIRNTATDLQIDCDLTVEDAYIYALNDENLRRITKEYEAYERLGIPNDYVDDIPLDIDVQGAVIMTKQSQFHPLKYLSKLVDEIVKNGGEIYEQTVAIDVEKNTKPTVITRDGHRITGKYVVSCSHFPFHDGKGLYFTKMHAERSYVLGIKSKKPFPGGMYYSADSPTRSLRYTPINGERLVLVSGDGHKTGQGMSTYKHYKALEEFGEKVLGIEEIPYRWSAQDLYTLDKIPYIGPITANEPNIFIATGYRKWGMTTGTAAGKLICDLIMKRENFYTELFDPSRFYADPSIKTFIMQNADVAKHLIKGKLDIAHKRIADISKDEGAIVVVNGQRTGAYKDKDGIVHCVDTTCTHMGCEVEWNSGDLTWDCPCHGSRFSIDGDVVEGPAKKPLKKIDID